jgi:hypothetical protein
MEPKTISENFSELSGNVRDYVNLKVDLLKITITEKLASIMSLFLVSVIFFILFLFIMMFLSLAFIFWYRDHIGSGSAGALIVAGFYILLALTVFLLRKKLFINPLVEGLSKILMEENEEHEK